ncbi:MAG: ergothioneine biosynthesis protein EgtB [Pseudomonadales bacterium]
MAFDAKPNAISENEPAVESELSRLASLTARYQTVRQQSLNLCQPLETEDFGVQPMADASPPKWHLAHTSWFFETFLLIDLQPGYQAFHPAYAELFNSYYNGVGQPFPRLRRGTLSRPTLKEVFNYRRAVDDATETLLLHAQKAPQTINLSHLNTVLEIGLEHEQQHQELLLTDIKYNFGHNPLAPTYRLQTIPAEPPNASALTFDAYEPGLVQIGAQSGGFAFDNERPRHEVFLRPFKVANRTVSNGEFLAFIEDNGYERPELWLAEAWQRLQDGTLAKQPLYWQQHQDGWYEYRLDGLHPLDKSRPVVHVSAFEAMAYATWANARLLTEAEWEWVAGHQPPQGNFVESQQFHPVASDKPQFFGNVWEWTSSSYAPYPGYRPLMGVLGEYNGKFMSSQLVLRGGSCATPKEHIRASYRNFFYPADRWQFSGIRLAQDV